MQELLQQVLSELRSAWRFRWYAVLAAWVTAAAGVGVVAWLPDVYEASARIYIDTTSVLRPLLSDRIVPPDVTTHLLYVRQALLGREYLERVAAEHGLDAEASSYAEREKMLERLRENIQIRADPAGRDNSAAGSNIFSISFRHERPEVAVGVVRSLTDALIEETLAGNREGTDIASRFLEERIAEHEARLQQAEQALAEFQRENFGKLPGSEGSYFERMQREREALEQVRRDLRLAESRRERLRQQLQSETPVMLEDPALNREPPPNSIDARIRDQRAELDRLLLQYTERHPEVIARRESLERLEQQRAEQLRSLGVSDSAQQLSTLGANPVYQAVQIALNEVEVEIATLEADARDREARLRELQALIDEVPGVEAELARLNRDYNIIYEQYQALVKSRETQQLSQQASATDQVDFRVLNPPIASPEPVAPPRLLLLAAVLVAAFGIGGGLSYVLSQIRPVFSSTKALREVTGFPVIGAVSRLTLDPMARIRRRVELVSFIMAVGALVAATGAVALFELVGPGVHSLVGGA
ncbi:MAG TPA: XrtA system polysaccharide chain length determinant [Vicinamibacterales bacterium]